MINVINKHKAEELKNLGFKYIINNFGKDKIYTFQKSDKLLQYLAKNYDKSEYFINNTICF